MIPVGDLEDAGRVWSAWLEIRLSRVRDYRDAPLCDVLM